MQFFPLKMHQLTRFTKMYLRMNIDTVWKDVIFIRYLTFNWPTCEMSLVLNFIWQSVLPVCMETIVLGIAVWLVEILGYVSMSRAIVTEVVLQGGKETCVRMVNMCYAHYMQYICMICSAIRIVCVWWVKVSEINNWAFPYI